MSGVDTNHPFLPLARRSVEDHILVYWNHQQWELLRNVEQVNVNARDVDTGDMYVMINILLKPCSPHHTVTELNENVVSLLLPLF